jgi:ribosomal protein L11 methylase PrmA
VGCGTSILSIFAAKAGAKHVYGVDNANIGRLKKILN